MSSEDDDKTGESIDKQYYQIMLDYSKGLTNTERDLSKEYFKSLWTFSSGALGLSITLVSGAFGASFNHGYSYLYISWVLFTACILFTMFSVKANQRAYRHEKDAIYDDLSRGTDISSDASCGGWDKATNVTELFASIFFISGIVLMICFINENVIF